MICAADIPYFKYFFSRLTTAALAWTDSFSFMFKMVFQEFQYWSMLFPLAIIIYLFIKGIRKTRKKFELRLDRIKPNTWQSVSFHIFSSIIVTGIIFLGIRGRIEEKSPIQVGTAFFSNYAFVNQLGLNPVFTFGLSYLDDQAKSNDDINLMDTHKAFNYVKRKLKAETGKNTPIGRASKYDQIEGRKNNVVLVIMESMSAEKMGRYGNTDHLTPFLDSLSEVSLNFDNFYTAGIHTYNGIFSTLYSFPAVYKKHPMKGFPIKEYGGLVPELRKANYRTAYFTTHDDQFDNVGGFLHTNGFQDIISEKDYPSSEVLSTLGVPDHYLFQFAIPKIDEIARNGDKFFVTFMTASDHGPYIIPEDIDFKSSHKDVKKQVVQYADWSIRRFMEEAKKTSWYENTVFIFIADHGYRGKATYDMPLEYHHSPFIIFNPKWTSQADSYPNMATQMDVGPTILGLIGVNWENNTLGIDLFRKERPYAFFCADDKLGCLSKDLFLVMRNNGLKSLYKYKSLDTKDYAGEYPEELNKMELYAKAMTAVAQELSKDQRTMIKSSTIE